MSKALKQSWNRSLHPARSIPRRDHCQTLWYSSFCYACRCFHRRLPDCQDVERRRIVLSQGKCPRTAFKTFPKTPGTTGSGRQPSKDTPQLQGFLCARAGLVSDRDLPFNPVLTRCECSVHIARPLRSSNTRTDSCSACTRLVATPCRRAPRIHRLHL
jgi:hypothetical protein